MLTEKPENRFAPGAVLVGRYRILHCLGQGGMGEVYRAEDLVLEQPVALKVLRNPSKTARLETLLNEVKIARRIAHPNVCQVYDIELTESLQFISMELVEGEDLASRLKRSGPQPPALALDLARQICRGLAAAHDRGVLHRDLKPANILIDRDGKVRITDFGVAVLAAEAEDGARGAGTPAYMAPEQHRGRTATVASDVYGLGLLLYELFTGRRPFEAELVEELAWRHCSVRPAPPSSLVECLDATVEQVILRCLEKTPRARPTSAREALEALSGESRSAVKALVHLEPVGGGACAPLLERIDAFPGVAVDDVGRTTRVFDQPAEGLKFALACQEAAGSFGAGLHLGEVTHADPSEVDGPSARIEAVAHTAVLRLAGMAEAGQILLTRAVFDLAREGVEGGIPGVCWLAHGSYEIEGITEPIEIFEVGRDGIAPLRPPRDSARARRRIAQPTVAGWRPAPGLELPLRPSWRIERKLSEGGFGEVWLAAHNKTHERRVFKFCFDVERLRALKREITLFRLLKEELGQRSDIARILDWDLERLPYYIESAYTAEGNLADWAEAQGGTESVPLETRLEIVAQVATALAAAHSVGVLHKDIKPSNVLIAQQDGTFRAQLTDFGIGQLTDRQRLSEAGITALGFTHTEKKETAEAGTRLYQAPEILEGKPATIQADVYALGVTLYQLVVGDLSRALAPGWEKDVDDLLLREDIAAAVDGSPERRLGNALRLAERLRGLAERRHAREADLRAREEAERLRISVARLRGRRRVMALVMTTVLLVSGVVGMLAWRVAREATRANREARSARQVAAFLVELFEGSDPYGAVRTAHEDGAAVTALELLDRGAARVSEGLTDEPEIQAQLLHVIGRIYRGLGDTEAAEPLLTRALELRHRLLGEDHPDVLETLDELGELRRFQGRFREAERLHRQVLEQRRRVLGARHADVAESADNLASVAEELGELDAAESLYREALALRVELLGKDHVLVAESLNNLALFLHSSKGDLSAAELLFRDAVRIFEDHYGHTHPEVVTALSNLGMVLDSRGDFEAAQTIYEEALAIRRHLLGDEHPAVATTLNNLAAVLEMQGLYEAAEPLYRETLEIRRKRLGNEHPLVALTLNNFAFLHMVKGDFAAAEPMFREALALRRRQLGKDHPKAVLQLRNLARVLSLQGRYAEAEQGFREAVAFSRQSFGDEHEEVALSLTGLGVCLFDGGEADLAEEVIREALAIRRKLFGNEHLAVAESLEQLGNILILQGEYAAAEATIHEALTIRRALWRPDHWRIAYTENLLGASLAGLGRSEEAEPLLLLGYSRVRDKMGNHFYYAQQALRHVIRFYERTGDRDQAAAYGEHAWTPRGGSSSKTEATRSGDASRNRP